MGLIICSQRFAVWRCGGILAQKFNSITNVEPCTNVSQNHLSRHIAKPMLAAVIIFKA